jgi:hypothetical protein
MSETETESDRDKGSHPSLGLCLPPAPPCPALKHGCWSACAHTDNQTDRQLDTLAPYHCSTYTQTATHSVMGFAFNPDTLTILRGREGTHTRTHAHTRTIHTHIHIRTCTHKQAFRHTTETQKQQETQSLCSPSSAPSQYHI